MKLNHHFRQTAAILCSFLFLLSCMLCGCRTDPLLPTGGYDYRTTAAGSAFLGYPIPRNGSNPYCYHLPLTGTLPPAFAYDSEKTEYIPLETMLCTLPLPGTEISVPCAQIEEHLTFFESYAKTEQITVYQGDIGGRAVVLSHADQILYLADETGAQPIAEHVLSVPDIYTEKNRLLFIDKDRLLYEYCEDNITQITDVAVSDAWYAYGADRSTVIFRQMSSAQTPAAPYYTEDGKAPVPCVIPPIESDMDTAVYIRNTAFLLQGNDDSAYFYDVRTGKRVEMDMGGVYRFPSKSRTAEAVVLPLSPDGQNVYFYDTDFIYRLNLSTADLALAYNEAPIFEGSCVLSSMTAVTDDIVVLSQGSNEYTEFVPTITIAVFEEDIPELRHEDDKIDLEYHSWQTDE